MFWFCSLRSYVIKMFKKKKNKWTINKKKKGFYVAIIFQERQFCFNDSLANHSDSESKRKTVFVRTTIGQSFESRYLISRFEKDYHHPNHLNHRLEWHDTQNRLFIWKWFLFLLVVFAFHNTKRNYFAETQAITGRLKWCLLVVVKRSNLMWMWIEENRDLVWA